LNRPWISHYDPGVETSIEYPDLTLPQLFDHAAQRYPEHIATIFHDARQRYRELARQIHAFAAGLRELHVRPGDRVAIMLPNVPQFIVAFYGALEAGAIVVPTNPLYTQRELEHQLADCGAVAIVTLDQLFPRVQMALPATEIHTVIVTGVGHALPRRLQPLYSLKQWRDGVRAVRRAGVVHRFSELLAASTPGDPLPGNPDEIAVLQYTGGTTGRSKAAMLTHRNLVSNALQAYHWQGETKQKEGGTRILCAAPFFHVYGLTVGMNLAVLAGATMLLVPRFIPKEIAAVAQKYKPALFPGVPTMYVALSELPGFSASQWGSLEICLSGAAPLPAEVQRRFQEVSNTRLVEGYGLTEASPVSHCNPARGEARPGSIGIPFPDTDAMITDPETWEPLPVDAIGELTIKGPQIMRGYWKRPEETAQVMRDGWLHTGDLATMDAAGYFSIVDRKKDLIIASGYKVYPHEVEEVLLTHPAIKEAAVIGVPNQYRGETVKAVVVLRDVAQSTDGRSSTGSRSSTASGLPEPAEIIALCRENLAAYKVPKIIEFRTELPKSLIGKVLRRELRDSIPTSNLSEVV
jgi:long-chain acyl-CoA synthetase